MTRVWKRAGQSGLLAVAYFATAKLGLSFAFVNASATAVWPPTGLSLAALLLLGRGLWPGVFVGAFAANITTSGSIGASALIACGNTLEAIVGAALIERWAAGRHAMRYTANVFRFALVAVLLAPAIAATTGTAALYWHHLAAASTLPSVWVTWSLGDGVGALLFGSLLLLWSERRPAHWTPARVAEVNLVFLATILVALMTVGGWSIPRVPIGFACLPLILWASLRFGQREAASCAALLSAITIWATIEGQGPFVRATQNASLLLLQSFNSVIALTGLVVGALVAEKAQLNADLERRVAERTLELRQMHESLVQEVDERERARARAEEDRASRDQEHAARQQAEQENRLKDRFLATVSQELRTPLKAMIGWTHTLTSGRITEDQLAKGLQVIERSAETQARLIDDLVDVAELATGRAKFEARRLELGSIIHAAVDAVDVAARAKQIAINVRLEGPAVIRGDARRLQQLVWKLVTNAVQFTPEGGWIEVRMTPSDSHVTIRVTDSGRGMHPDDVAHAFDPFWQGGAVRSEGRLGVGLAIVRAVAEAHGGTVNAMSASVERAASFLVRLPTAKRSERGLEAGPVESDR
jgi:signal transduction histidine kinase